MILIDTSVWIDHFHTVNSRIAVWTETRSILIHPFVIGELACGSIRNRREVLEHLAKLPSSVVAGEAETLHFLDHHFLMGKGLSYVDVHLLAAVVLQDAKLYTRDKRLREAAVRLHVAFIPT